MRPGDRLADESVPRRGEPLRQHRVNGHRALHAEVAIFGMYTRTLVRGSPRKFYPTSLYCRRKPHASISTRAPSGKPATPTVVWAGFAMPTPRA